MSKFFSVDHWNRTVFLVFSVFFILCSIALILNYIFTTTSSVSVGPGPHDLIEEMIDVLSISNAKDFDIFYHLNILVHSVLILMSVASTILVSLITKENIIKIRVVTIYTTGITAVLTAFLSTFHIQAYAQQFGILSYKLNILSASYELARGDLIYDSKADRKYYIVSTPDKLPYVAGGLSPQKKSIIFSNFYRCLMKIDEARVLMYADLGNERRGPFSSDNTDLISKQCSLNATKSLKRTVEGK